MKTRTIALTLVLSVAGGLGSAALAEDVALPALYKSLAEKNHYAVVEGIQNAQADVKCNILDQVVAAFPDAAGKPVTVKFFWSRPDPNAAPAKKFAVSGVPDGLTDLSKRATAIFQEAQDFVFTDPPYWTIANTNATAASENGTITVKGVAKAPTDPIKNLLVVIDGASYQVKKMDMDLGQAHVVIENSSKDLGGKWGVESTSLQYPQYKKVISFEYAQTDNFWAPSKMSISFLGPDGKELQPSFVYEFSNWQVNKGLPPGTF